MQTQKQTRLPKTGGINGGLSPRAVPEEWLRMIEMMCGMAPLSSVWNAICEEAVSANPRREVSTSV